LSGEETLKADAGMATAVRKKACLMGEGRAGEKDKSKGGRKLGRGEYTLTASTDSRKLNIPELKKKTISAYPEGKKKRCLTEKKRRLGGRKTQQPRKKRGREGDESKIAAFTIIFGEFGREGWWDWRREEDTV